MSKINQKYFFYILWGLYIFYLGLILSDYILPKYKAVHIVTIVGAVFFLYGLIFIHKNYKGCDKLFVYLFSFYLLVCFVHLIFGIPMTILQGRIAEMIYNQQYMWMFVIGFSLLIPIKPVDLPIIFNFVLLYLVSSLVFSIYNFSDLFLNPVEILKDARVYGNEGIIVNRAQESSFLFQPVFILLLFYVSLKNKIKVLIWLSFILSLLATLFMGRRSASVILIGYLLLPFFVKLLGKKKTLLNILTAIIVLIIFILPNIMYSNVEEFWEDNFTVMSKRLDDDTRSGTENDFFKDMKTMDEWVTGRGMVGVYKSPAVADVDKLYRPIIETGYLNMILHGGLLLLIPYVLILISSFVKGFFYSKNRFVKCCGIFCLYYLVLLYPGGHLKLTMICLMLFMAIRICQSNMWRNMSDEDIQEIIMK